MPPMNGLLANAPVPPAAAPAPPGAGMEPGAEAEADGNVSPEEQAEYEQFVTTAMKLVYDPKMRDTILDRLSSTDQPVDDLANTAVMVVQRVEQSAEKAGTKVSDDVVFHGGLEILEDLAEYAETAKIHTFTEEELEGAWYRALDLYREMGTQSGRVDGESLKAQFGEIVDADKAGGIEQVLPGIGARAQPPAPVEDEEA